MSNTVHQNLFQSLGQLLNLLVNLVSRDLTSLFSDAHAWIDSLCKKEAVASRACSIALLHCTEESKDDCMKLLNKLCSEFLKLLSTAQSTEFENVEKLLKILDIWKGVFTTQCSILHAWFLTEKGQSFMQPLLSWLIRYGLNSSVSNSLSMFRALQRAVNLLQKMLYLNPVLQEKFCTVLYATLQEYKSPHMSGYLKYILNQLVVVDETINFTFQMKDVGEEVVVNTHQIQLRLTSTIGDIAKTIKKFRNSLFSPVPVQIVSDEKSSSSKSSPSSSASSSSASSLSKSSSNPSSSLVIPLLFTGNAAVVKRKSKQQKQQQQQPDFSKVTPMTVPESLDTVAVQFFAKNISNNVLPSDLKISQILQVIHERGQLTSTPTLLYNIFNRNHHKTTVFDEEEEAIDWSKQKPMMSVFERFAEIGGLPLLLPNHHEHSSSHVGLLLKIVSLPGFSQVFLGDVIKAQLLLRSVMGVKETKLGRKHYSIIH